MDYPCTICGDTNWVKVSETDRHGKPLETAVCKSCGLVSNLPVPDPQTLEKFYTEDYRVSYKGAHNPRIRQVYRNFKRTIGQLEWLYPHLAGREQVLDIGSGSGEFLFLVQSLGKKVRGIEPNKGYSDYCRKVLGLDVQTSPIDQSLFEANQFDFIRINHVLEHIADPVNCLSILKSWLVDDGVLHVEVPNIEAYCQIKSVGNMFHFGHIYNFNPESLVAVAGLAGLTPVSDQPVSVSTSIVFCKGAIQSQQSMKNSENGQKVLEMVEAHYAAAFKQVNKNQRVAKIKNRLEEIVRGAMLGSPQAIGGHFAKELMRRYTP